MAAGQTLLRQFSDALAGTAEAVRPAVVQVVDASGSLGAGTIWHAEGLILTNAHVVLRQEHRRVVTAPDLRVVTGDDQVLPAQVIATDEQADLAALAVEAAGLPTVTVGDSRSLRPGQWVMALGHPWGVRDAATAGVVIGMGDDLPEMRPGREWIALNLTLRPGHSGGPLVDAAGRVVGINTMISGPEVGFAVPVHQVKAFLASRLGRNVAGTLIV